MHFHKIYMVAAIESTNWSKFLFIWWLFGNFWWRRKQASPVAIETDSGALLHLSSVADAAAADDEDALLRHHNDTGDIKVWSLWVTTLAAADSI